MKILGMTDEQIDNVMSLGMAPYLTLCGPTEIRRFARAVIAADRELQDARHAEELAAYELTVSNLRAELERERMRLTACGVVAMADTPDSAAKAREMHPDYKSASCDDVARRVDECIRLRTELAGRSVPNGKALVSQGALQLAINVLRRDAANGMAVRGEIADELMLAAAPQPAAQPEVGRQPAIDYDASYGEHLAQLDGLPNPTMCSSCNGSGETEYMTTHYGPDDYSVAGPCMTCGGSGVAAPQPAEQPHQSQCDCRKMGDPDQCDERDGCRAIAHFKRGAAQPEPVPTSVSRSKRAQLEAHGYVVNGVSLMHPETRQRALLDDYGFVGWWQAQPAAALTDDEIFLAYTAATGKTLPTLGPSRNDLIAISRAVIAAHEAKKGGEA